MTNLNEITIELLSADNKGELEKHLEENAVLKDPTKALVKELRDKVVKILERDNELEIAAKTRFWFNQKIEELDEPEKGVILRKLFGGPGGFTDSE